MTHKVQADYLVVGAGAMGMAFADALIDHADARVAIVDRRHGSGGHWLDAYPFARLHQASAFYGVASTLLGAYLSFFLDSAPAPTIVLVLTAMFLAAFARRMLLNRRTVAAV